MGQPVSNRIKTLGRSVDLLFELIGSDYMGGRAGPLANDFVFGNPHDPALPDFVEALQRNLPPKDKNWFAYKMNEPEATKVVVETLNRTLSLAFSTDHVLMTNGTFASLAVCMSALVDPGDEVIFISPPWFFYEALICAVGATAVRVDADRETFDLDVAAVEAAITDRTRAIIINSPNNPTGRIYSEQTLQRLGRILTAASEKCGRAVYLLSDEAYKRILFDGRNYPSPVEFYDNSLLLYTYGKTLLTPGQRLGYIALNPAMPEVAAVAQAIVLAQALAGWAFPNALLQHSLADLEGLSIDVAQLQRKRDRMMGELTAAGYEANTPEGTFYLLVKSPWTDDMAFGKLLAQKDIYVLPGSTFELPGYFRLSLTANDEMIERALPGFTLAISEAQSDA